MPNIFTARLDRIENDSLVVVYSRRGYEDIEYFINPSEEVLDEPTPEWVEEQIEYHAEDVFNLWQEQTNIKERMNHRRLWNLFRMSTPQQTRERVMQPREVDETPKTILQPRNQYRIEEL